MTAFTVRLSSSPRYKSIIQYLCLFRIRLDRLLFLIKIIRNALVPNTFNYFFFLLYCPCCLLVNVLISSIIFLLFPVFDTQPLQTTFFFLPSIATDFSFPLAQTFKQLVSPLPFPLSRLWNYAIWFLQFTVIDIYFQFKHCITNLWGLTYNTIMVESFKDVNLFLGCNSSRVNLFSLLFPPVLKICSSQGAC